ncbi:hypothetical protein GCM10007923_64560 [Shinella yambaruensis]|uniref:Uncharacterized protein n=1 Tax=Shinella yambaruensis TaxID=415996 RepID=A0ABQ5ZX97_9HYPH|nr:hypothetical protein GCM10007923_64560 [Shinella yambaruensis]
MNRKMASTTVMMLPRHGSCGRALLKRVIAWRRKGGKAEEPPFRRGFFCRCGMPRKNAQRFCDSGIRKTRALKRKEGIGKLAMCFRG